MKGEKLLTTGTPKLSDSINKAFVKVRGPPKTRFGVRGENKTRVSEVSVIGSTLHVFLPNTPFMGMYQPRKHSNPVLLLLVAVVVE